MAGGQIVIVFLGFVVKVNGAALGLRGCPGRQDIGRVGDCTRLLDDAYLFFPFGDFEFGNARFFNEVDQFFDKVMVNVDDPALRGNRLGLLKALFDQLNAVADISKLGV